MWGHSIAFLELSPDSSVAQVVHLQNQTRAFQLVVVREALPSRKQVHNFLPHPSHISHVVPLDMYMPLFFSEFLFLCSVVLSDNKTERNRAYSKLCCLSLRCLTEHISVLKFLFRDQTLYNVVHCKKEGDKSTLNHMQFCGRAVQAVFPVIMTYMRNFAKRHFDMELYG